MSRKSFEELVTEITLDEDEAAEYLWYMYESAYEQGQSLIGTKETIKNIHRALGEQAGRKLAELDGTHKDSLLLEKFSRELVSGAFQVGRMGGEKMDREDFETEYLEIE